jgi:hypothetical protein
MRQVSTVILLLIVAVACHAYAETDKQEINTAILTKYLWVHLDSEWEPYGDETSSTDVAYARVLHFGSDGEFSWIACMLLRNKSQNWTTISAGDGQVIFMGRWRALDDGVEVQYVKTYEMVHADGSDLPFSKVKKAIVRLSGHELIFDGRSYSMANAPDEKLYEEEYIAPERLKHSERLRSYFHR